jgi:hypothetical protein
MRDVTVALTDSRFAGQAFLPADPSDLSIHYPAWLAFAQERGHGRAAAEWAVYRLAEMGRLAVDWPLIYQHSSFRIRDWFEDFHNRIRGEEPHAVRYWDLSDSGRLLRIVSTPALWEWFRGGCQMHNPTQRISEAPSNRTGKGKNIDAQMLKIMADNVESHGWSARQWADHLVCSPGTVKETKTWKERLKAARATRAADAACRMDRSGTRPAGQRKAKHKSEW